jgi:hypothetical protein
MLSMIGISMIDDTAKVGKLQEGNGMAKAMP